MGRGRDPTLLCSPVAKRKRRALIPTEPCPCGSEVLYSDCCLAVHHQPSSAITAETVMRARYTAHVVDNVDYLRVSWHPDTCPDEMAVTGTNERWLGLELRSVEQGGALD
ncbi:MAG: SEC-C motif-containing protein, partial [Acidimicrobiales bacterium]